MQIELVDMLDATPLERAQISITLEAASSLVEFYEENPPPWHWCELAWNLRFAFGDDGYELFDIAAHSWDEPPASQSDIDKLWAQADRPVPTQFDTILFDAMNDARWKGWQPPAELLGLFDQLAQLEVSIDEKWNATAHIRAFLDNARDPASIMPDVNATMGMPMPQPYRDITPVPMTSLITSRGDVEILPSDSDEALSQEFAAKHANDLRFVAAWGR